MATGQKLLVFAQKDSHKAISERLWSFRPESFLAHAADEDAGQEHAQIWLTSDVTANQIGARFLALTAGLEPPEIQKFDRVFNLFEGTSDTAISVARDSWRRWSRKNDVTCRYFYKMIGALEPKILSYSISRFLLKHIKKYPLSSRLSLI